jgi:hypothetical protein
MALTGHLSDLSLSELIEFFCNQRKSGQLKVLYPQGQAYFYLQMGSVVDARIGVLRGIDAVFYALTLPNAKFEFSASAESTERTINQPWTQVVLEGLRRLDEGINPSEAFPPSYVEEAADGEVKEGQSSSAESIAAAEGASLFSFGGNESTAKRKGFFVGAVIVAVLGSIAGIGVPAGWYHRRAKVVAAPAPQVESASVAPAPESSVVPEAPKPESADSVNATDNAAAIAARRQRERARLREEQAALAGQTGTTNPTAAGGDSVRTGPKKVTVTVAYDETGRVTQASGGDSTAVRIARQKRFPPGKAGSATITIPIN